MRFKRIICIGGICAFFAVVSLFLGSGDASGQTPLTIDNPDLSMSFNASQDLSASGGCPPYNWSLSGGGTLTPNGASATYVAPASNNNCANNPMITLTDGCRNMADIQIAVTTNLGIALRQIRFVLCYIDPNNGVEYGLIEGEWWYCDGTSTGSSCYTAAGPWGPCPWCWTGPCDCGRYWGDDGYPCVKGAQSFQCAMCPSPYECDVVADVRGAMKAAGCCPINPETGLPFDNALPNSEQRGKNAGLPPKVDDKINVACETGLIVVNPVNVATGNKYEEVLDLSISTPGIPLEFRRSYNSQVIIDGPLGYGWTHTYGMILNVVQTTPTKRVRIWDSDGRALYFSEVQQTSTEILFGGESGVKDRLKQVISTGEYFLRRKEGNLTYKFGSNGKLVQISDPNGNTMTLTYTGGLLTQVADNFGKSLSIQYNNNRISSVTDPKSQSVSYQYQNGDLWKVTYADSNFITYAYSNHNLTDKYDTNNNLIGHWEYDNRHRVTTYYSHIKEGVHQEEINLTYPTGKTELRRTIGTETYLTTYTTADIDGIKVVKEIQGCSTCGSVHKKFEYSNRLDLTDVTSINDSDGTSITTHYTYDNPSNPWEQVGEVLEMKEAVKNPPVPEQRTTNYSYTHRTDDPSLLTQSTETIKSVVDTQQNKVITLTYDTAGNILSRQESGYVLINGTPTQKAYNTSYQYNALGQLTQINGPRTDVSDITTVEYYANTPGEGNNRAQLKAIINALAQRTEFSQYDANGNIGKIKDPNNVETQYTYDERNRIKTITNLSTTAQTQYFYDARGNLSYVILPEGNRIDFTYNLANKLTEIRDNLGNKILYQYDVEGNRTREETKDPQGTLKRYLDFTYDAYKHLKKIINPDTNYTEYTYDGRGNRTAAKDPKNYTTTFTYDPLSRIKDMTQPGSVITVYGYDIQDNQTSVKDPNEHTTTYVYDDFGRKNKTTSPDTGTTRYEYDEAGNLVKKVDAKGTPVIYTYDALNRLRTIDFPGSTEDIEFTYDSPVSFGIGRLTGRIDPSGTYVFHYDAHGNMIREEKTVGGILYTTQFGYDKNNNLSSIIYPSGRTVTYVPDGARRISRVDTVPAPGGQPLASNIQYLPFGGITSLTYGNNLTLSQGYDTQYRITSIVAGSVLNLAYGYDPNGNVISIVDSANPSGGPTPEPLETYTYGQGTNNRLTQISGTTLTTFEYDDNGNIRLENTSPHLWTHVYDSSNQLTQALYDSNEVAAYVYNGAGQRIKKVAGGTTRIFHYDLRGHLIAETNQSGTMLAEYVYLGDQLLAMIKPGNLAYYFHNDHLGTPQVLTGASGSIAWKAVYTPFGEAAITIETVQNPFRFPGQYYDAETGLHYNYFRYYNPPIGRYLTPDPIGLGGGINLFTYVANNPVNLIDPLGLLSEEELKRLLAEAKSWVGTPFAEVGKKSKKGVGADCSGSVYRIFNNAGFPIEYFRSPDFPQNPYFWPAPDNIPEPGDVGWWNGHIVIYDPNAQFGKQEGNVWSAYRPGVTYGPGMYQWFNNKYGPVKWYRYYRFE